MAMIDAGLVVVLVVACGYVCAAVWRKLPLLLQVPEQLIEESFVTRPSRLNRWAGPAVEFFAQRRWFDLYYAILVGALSRLRVWLLRLERMVFRTLERIESQGRRWGIGEERYWSELKQWKQESKENGGATIPMAVFHPEAPPRPKRRPAAPKQPAV